MCFQALNCGGVILWADIGPTEVLHSKFHVLPMCYCRAISSQSWHLKSSEREWMIGQELIFACGMYNCRPLANRCWKSNLHSSHYSWHSWQKRKCFPDSSYIELYCSFGDVQKSGYISRIVSAMDCWLGSAFCLRIVDCLICTSCTNVPSLHARLSNQAYSLTNIVDLGH